MANESLLAQIVEDPRLRSPLGLALQVCEKAGRPDCTLEVIGELIRLDPALCAQILKAVNSGLYGLPRAVTSVDRALSLLGLRAVRSLVLSLSLPAVQCRGATDAQMQEFWKSSVAAAILARELATRLRRQSADDDMVAGLLCDLGVVVLRQGQPDAYAKVLAAPPEVLATNRCWVEDQALGVTHAEVAAYLLRRWGLPADITEAIRHHHQPDQAAAAGPAVRDRAWLLHFATLAAQLQVPPGPPVLGRDIVRLARDRFGMNEQDLGDFLEPLTAKVDALAALLNLDIGRCGDFTAVLARSIDELSRLTVGTSLDRCRAEEERRQAEQEAAQWRKTALRLRREATRDLVTDLFNRGFFEETLALEFKRAARRSTVLGVVLIGVDGFKGLNDALGQAFGDQVLREVATRLKREVRSGEIVARCGGDEFGAVVVDTSVAGLQALAGRLARAVNSLTVRREGGEEKIAVAVGAAACFPRRPGQTQQALLAAADQAMHAAKAARHERLALVSLLSDQDARLLEEVRRRLFSVFLVGSGRVSEDQIHEALRSAPPAPQAIGRLARRLGWISPGQVRRVLHAQRQTRELFGEIALARGYLRPEQLFCLMAFQRERPEDLADGLVDHGALTEAQARACLAEYHNSLQQMGGLGHRPVGLRTG